MGLVETRYRRKFTGCRNFRASPKGYDVSSPCHSLVFSSRSMTEYEKIRGSSTDKREENRIELKLPVYNTNAVMNFLCIRKKNQNMFLLNFCF